MIDEVNIDNDENGFALVLTGDFSDAIVQYEAGDDCRLVLRLPQDAAIQLLAHVRSEIGPWLAEAEAAMQEWRAMRNIEDDRDAYQVDDPKHPGFRERVADIADARRKRMREAS